MVTENVEGWADFCVALGAFGCLLTSLQLSFQDAGVAGVKAKVLAVVQKFVGEGIAEPISKDAEQLELYAASLAEENTARANLLLAAQTATVLLESGATDSFNNT